MGIVGLGLLALFVLPLVLRQGWGPDAALVQAILAALMIDALFIDVFGYRKEVWIAIGMASGLAYLARQEGLAPQAAPVAAPPAAPRTERPAGPRRPAPIAGRRGAAATPAPASAPSRASAPAPKPGARDRARAQD